MKSRGAKIRVKTKSGIADAVIRINGEPFVVEIKDYNSKPICLSDIKQVKRYLIDLDIKYGIIINSKVGEIKRVKSDNFEIIIIPEDKINEIWGRSLTRQDRI